MIYLFEGYKYEKETIEKYLSCKDLYKPFSKKDTSHAKPCVVGYFFNKDLNHGKGDMVFILPKVCIYNDKGVSLIDEDEEDVVSQKNAVSQNVDNFKAFGRYDPTKIIEHVFDEKDPDEGEKECGRLVYSLSLWLYRAIKHYHQRYPNNTSVNVGSDEWQRLSYNHTRATRNSTLLDYALALVKFTEDHRNYFTFIAKKSHSDIYKINWKDTIAHTLPYHNSAGKPIYFQPVTKKKEINYEEELIVILLSTLRNLTQKYGLKVPKRDGFKLMSNSDFRNFEKTACIRLRKLKHKYFSDISVELWKLLYDYFRREHDMSSRQQTNDLLVVNSMNCVFEDMVDYLISDEGLPKRLHKLGSNEIDHIYSYESLLYNETNQDDEIYYVGDSKYYHDGHQLNDNDLDKQFIYAKNVIQQNIDVFYELSGRKTNSNVYHRYRDKLTEGYDITPNFFITGRLFEEKEKPLFNFDNEHFEITDENFIRSQQFKNRLFDRDTLILQRYNINFLYVLGVYAKQSTAKREEFKKSAQKIFKNALVDELKEHYLFYRLELEENKLEGFVTANFRWLTGKMFSFQQEDNKTFLLLAFEKPETGQGSFKCDDGLIEIDDVSASPGLVTLHVNSGIYLLRKCELTNDGVKEM